MLLYTQAAGISSAKVFQEEKGLWRKELKAALSSPIMQTSLTRSTISWQSGKIPTPFCTNGIMQRTSINCLPPPTVHQALKSTQAYSGGIGKNCSVGA